MGTRTQMTVVAFCDICNEERDEADMVRLYGPLERGKRAQADVCAACQDRPISELVAWLNNRRQENTPRSLRSVNGATGSLR